MRSQPPALLKCSLIFALLLLSCTSGRVFTPTASPTPPPATDANDTSYQTPTFEPTDSPSPIPSPTQDFGAPILTSLLGRTPDFALSPAQWDSAPDQHLQRQLVDGKWVWTNPPDNFARINLPGAAYANFVMTVDITTFAAPAEASFGVFWRMADPGEYRLNIDVNFTRWNLSFISYPEESKFIDLRNGVFSTPPTSGGPYALTVVASSHRMALYLNGSPLCDWSDDRPMEGALGFTLENANTAWKISFSNLKVWNLDKVPGLTK
jgi:hypothetical protein